MLCTLWSQPTTDVSTTELVNILIIIIIILLISNLITIISIIIITIIIIIIIIIIINSFTQWTQKKYTKFKILFVKCWIVPCKSPAEEVSFELLHHMNSLAVSKVRTTL